jgi:hypothetical protein
METNREKVYHFGPLGPPRNATSAARRVFHDELDSEFIRSASVLELGHTLCDGCQVRGTESGLPRMEWVIKVRLIWLYAG